MTFRFSMVLVFATGLMCGGLSGCGTEAPADEPVVVYICRETNELISGPPQPTPAVNPNTGRRTLVPALYCEKCRRWRAVPPSEVFNANPRSLKCPRHNVPLSTNGPIPNGNSNSFSRERAPTGR